MRIRFRTFAIGLIATALLLPGVAGARGSHASHNSSGTAYGGGHHTTSHGGHYVGGQGSSHKGGHYKNSKTGDRYGHHKPGE
jgi:hypothetical protein